MAYALSSVVFDLALLLGAYVIGLAALTRLVVVRPAIAGPSLHLLAVAIGVGCESLLLFILAAAGVLQPLAVAGSLAATVLAGGYLLAGLPTRSLGADLARSLRRCAADHRLFCAGVAIAGAAGFLLAMSAPMEWDELAYHLPYARDYAEAGGLEVSDYLRYPLQAHNYHLLYAAALLFGPEASTHLLHAFSAGLVAAGVIVLGRALFTFAAGVLAALLYLATAGHLIDSAMVDLGASMFVFYALFSLILWQRHGDEGFLMVSAFLLAMAVGTKYQALTQLPGFLLAAAAATARYPGPAAAQFSRAGGAAVWPAARALAVFAVFGGYWYVRNWWISGDPVHPMGAGVFGYWLWDAGDLAGQRADVARYRDHLPVELIPSLLFFLLAGWRRPERLTLQVVALAGLATWYLTSRYDRYLLATYPMLALLSAAVVVEAGRRLAPGSVRAALRRAGGVSGLKALRVFGFALFAAVMIRSVANGWETVCLTRECVDLVHARRLSSFAPAASVPGFRDLRLYQFGLEDERYYLGQRVPGDWFGPYRYRPILQAAGDPAAVRDELRRMGRDSILVNRRREPFNALGAAAPLAPEFETLYEDDSVALYRIAGE